MALALMRRHRRWLYVFLWLVIAAFIILYIPAFQGEPSGTPGETVVEIGGLRVSVGEFQRNYGRQRQVYDRLYQGRLNDAMLEQIQQQVLETLVVDRLVQLEAKRLGLKVSDEAVARAIASSPEFQDDGRFIGSEEIRRRLDLQGLSEEQLAEEQRRDLLRSSLEELIGSAASVSEAEIERELLRRSERVKLEYVLVDSARFRAAVAPSEDEIAARLAARKDAYRFPERRVVSYVLLDREALQGQVSVQDRELEAYYQDHQDDYRQEEEACASHILIKVREGEVGEGRPDAEAQQAAQTLLEQLKAGADFAALAKKASQDAGSAERGGDLGCFGPGRMAPGFDDAVFRLNPGETSELVKTTHGYHIIRLLSLRPSSVLPFAQVKETIRAAVIGRKLRELGDQKAQALAERLGRGKSLEEAAKAEGLSVRKSPPFARGETPAGLASATLVARAFALKPGQVEKEGFAVPQGAVFVALAEVLPARDAELKEVHDRIRGDLAEEGARAQALALATSVKEKAASLGLEKAAASAGLVRKETPQLVGRGQPLGELGTGLALEQAAFTLAEKTLSDPVRVASGYAVLRVLERQSGSPGEIGAQRDEIATSLRGQKRGELMRAFLMEARERYTIARNAGAYRRAIGAQE